MRLKNTSVSDEILAERRADLLSPPSPPGRQEGLLHVLLFAVPMMFTFLSVL